MDLSVALYEVRTYWNTVIRLRDADGQLMHNSTLAGSPVYLCVFAAQGNAGYLISPDRSVAMRLHGVENIPSIVSLRITQCSDGRVQFRHPIVDHLVTAEPLDEAGTGRLVCNRGTAGEWEDFGLDQQTDLPASLTAEIDQLRMIIRQTLTPWGTLALLTQSMIPADLHALAAVLQLWSIANLSWLGRQLREDSAVCAGLARALPNDIWAQIALPSLHTYKTSSIDEALGGSIRSIPEALDGLAAIGADGRYATLGHLCNALARRATQPTRDVCILATARNEGLYLLEWIAYHRLLGIRSIFLYTNDNDDGSDELLSALAQAGVIHWIQNNTRPQVSPQYKAYGHALQIMPDILDFRWVAVIDIDEFIGLDRAAYPTLTDYLNWQEKQPTDAVALCWVMVGPGTVTHREPTPVIRRFKRREPGVNQHVKSIFRPALFSHAHCHYPQWDASLVWNFRDEDGSPHPKIRDEGQAAFAPNPSDRHAWINHYYAKSAEEYILRRASSRGDMELSRAPDASFFTPGACEHFREAMQSPTVVIDERVSASVPGLEAEIAALVSLPGVAKAAAEIEARQRGRLLVLRDTLVRDPRFHQAGSSEAWFLAQVEESLRLSSAAL